MRSRSFDLVGIVVQTDNVASSESRDLPGGLADTTADIEDSHRLIDLDPMGEIVLVASESLQQRFTDTESTKVERLRPGFFVEVCG